MQNKQSHQNKQNLLPLSRFNQKQANLSVTWDKRSAIQANWSTHLG